MASKTPQLRRSLQVESLEKRELLAFDLVSDFSPRPKSSNPSEFLWYQQGSSPENGPKYLYSAFKEGVGREIVSYRPKIGEYFAIDINAGQEGSEPAELTQLGKHVIFSADGGNEKGRELWVLLNGTTPQLVRDISPGSTSSDPGGFIVSGDWIFFSAAVNGNRELWRTDGTFANTVKVKEINAWPADGSNPTDFVVLGTEVYFSADDGVNGRELWRTNGTAAGTNMVRNIAPGAVSSGVKDITKAGNRIYFSAFHPNTGRELWTSDGTNAGTKLVKNLNGSGFSAFKSSNPEELTAAGNDLYFRATTDAFGTELYRYEPTIFNDVWMVKDIVPGNSSSYPHEITATNGFIYFGANGELWRTNGISTGTVRVQTLNNFQIGTGPENVFYQDGFIYYQASHPWLSQELWITNASTGVTVFHDINPSINGNSYPEHFARGDGRVFFSADNGQEGVELFSIAGNATPGLSVNLNPGNGDSRIVTTLHNQNSAVLNSWSYFVVHSELGESNLWKHQPNTGELVQISSGAPQWVTNVQATSNVVYFTSYTDPKTIDVWNTNGNAPTLVKSLSYPSSNYVTVLATYAVGSAVYLVLEESSGGGNKLHLWRSNGTASGTVEIPLPVNTKFHRQGLVVDNSLYLTMTIGVDLKLLKVTSATLVEVPDVKLLGEYIIKQGTNLVFSGYKGTGEFGLHITNGTSAGTQLLKAGIGIGTKSYAELGGKLYFNGKDNDSEPWTTDGTAAGTQMLRNINDSGDSNPSEFTTVGNRVFFAATSPANGRELWKSTGTTASTVMVKPLASGTQSSNPRNLVGTTGLLYFFASIGQPGFETDRLFVSDGTNTGTKQVSTTGSTATYEFPGQVLFANGHNLYFEAVVYSGGKHLGIEPMVYKGGLVFPAAVSQPQANPSASRSNSVQDQALASLDLETIATDLKKRLNRTA